MLDLSSVMKLLRLGRGGRSGVLLGDQSVALLSDLGFIIQEVLNILPLAAALLLGRLVHEDYLEVRSVSIGCIQNLLLFRHQIFPLLL